MEVKEFNEIIADMKDFAVGHQENATDFNDGSIIKTIFEATAREIERLYVKTRNGFNNMLRNIPTSIFNFEKKEGLKATGTVKFSRNQAISTVTVIPTNTRVKSGDLIYVTTEEGSINANTVQSGSIKVQAEKVGSIYNIEVNKINVIDSIVSADVVSVTNDSVIQGGMDGEEEAQWGERFNIMVNGLQGISKYGIKSHVLAYTDDTTMIKDCKVNDHFPPDEDGNNFTVVIDTGADEATASQIDAINNLIMGNDITPGLYAPGTQFNVVGADVTPVNVTFKYKRIITDDNIEEEIKDVIRNYINSLKIGESLYLCDLICRINHIDAIEDIQIVEPSDNVILDADSDKVLKAGELSSTPYN